MSQNKYSNFVRPLSPNGSQVYTLYPRINGEEAKKLYLEEVKDIGNPEPVAHEDIHDTSTVRRKGLVVHNDEPRIFTDKDLFLSAQNDNVNTLKLILDKYPDKIDLLDDYGWSLLMIACQANSVHSVKELLRRDANTSVRDKAKNSAQNLVIKNKNLALVDLLLSHKKKKSIEERYGQVEQEKIIKTKLSETFNCEICNKSYPDRINHLSSTIHNMNASKGRKIPANYVIPPSNIGYQLMLKEGWDRESGLGPDGSGKRYPIKTIQKKDRKGLGLDKRKERGETEREKIQKQTKKARERERRHNRRMEAAFRREFY